MSGFHQLSRKLIVCLEVPMLRLIFSLAGAHEIVIRHSLKDGEGFNVFMSDFDLSVIASEDQFAFLAKVAEGIKKIFMNLGELEFYTDNEWQEYKALLTQRESEFWKRLLLIRKLKWQSIALRAGTSDSYQRTKLSRGVLITKQKLGLNSDEFFLDGLFPELIGGAEEAEETASFSPFLESPLRFRSAEAARNLWSILPDNKNIPNDSFRKSLKFYVLKREYYLTLVSIRSDIYTGKSADLVQKKGWLAYLAGRIEKKW
jgi:hypothetical protein